MLSNQVNTAPRIVVIDDFLTSDECKYMIEFARPLMKSSVVVDEETGKFVTHSARTSPNSYISAGADEVADRIALRLAEYANLPLENGESLQVLHYGVGGEYKPHFDYFDPALSGSKAVLAQGGQRVTTIILYLNTVEAGGETYFPDLDLKVTPQQGRAVLFDNVTTHGDIEPLSLHASLPVTAGEKWALSRWIRENRWG